MLYIGPRISYNYAYSMLILNLNVEYKNVYINLNSDCLL